MPLYKLILAYDGTAYFGWQKTRMGPSIQEALERALMQVAKEEVLPEGASRTDRGVHAVGQVAALSLKKEWDIYSLQRALNAALPLDIRVKSIERPLPSFHPTLDAKEKEYRYSICLGAVQDPVYRLYSWAFRLPLDLEKMKRASEDLIGRRDFSALANEEKENPFCTLSRIEIVLLEENRLQIAITGDRFLYKMARNIAGTLVYVGCGKLPPEGISQILSSKDRRQAGITAPARGLALYRVSYIK